VAIFCCARAEPLKKVINKTAGKIIRKMFLMGTGKQNFQRTPTENWRVPTPVRPIMARAFATGKTVGKCWRAAYW
jgi:hypothetical protein